MSQILAEINEINCFVCSFGFRPSGSSCLLCDAHESYPLTETDPTFLDILKCPDSQFVPTGFEDICSTQLGSGDVGSFPELDICSTKLDPVIPAAVAARLEGSEPAQFVLPSADEKVNVLSAKKKGRSKKESVHARFGAACSPSNLFDQQCVRDMAMQMARDKKRRMTFEDDGIFYLAADPTAIIKVSYVVMKHVFVSTAKDHDSAFFFRLGEDPELFEYHNHCFADRDGSVTLSRPEKIGLPSSAFEHSILDDTFHVAEPDVTYSFL